MKNIDVYLIKTREYGWVIGFVPEIEGSELDGLLFYKGFNLWDCRLDMAEFFDTEEDAERVCIDRNYRII